MVSIIGLDSDKVQQLCDAANQEVDDANQVQIANYLCPVRILQTSRSPMISLAGSCLLIDVINISLLYCHMYSGREIMLCLEA